MSGGNRRMSCEDAFFPDCFNVLMTNGRSTGFPCCFVEKLERQEARMPLVHMESLDVFVTEGSEHFDFPDSEDRFLTNPVMLIPAVKKVRDSSVPVGIFGDIGIQEVDRYLKASDPSDFVLPGTKPNSASFYNHGGSLWHLRRKVINDPIHRFF